MPSIILILPEWNDWNELLEGEGELKNVYGSKKGGIELSIFFLFLKVYKNCIENVSWSIRSTNITIVII